MIRLKDVRIGNVILPYALSVAPHDYCRILAINPDGLHHEKVKLQSLISEKITTASEGNCHGVPITKEVLQKVGFRIASSIDSSPSFENPAGDRILFAGDSWVLRLPHGDDIKLFYLHDLQNAYYLVHDKEEMEVCEVALPF